MRATFGFRSETDLEGWTRDNREGLRPDAMPYGMNKLVANGIDLDTAVLPPVSRKDQFSLLLRRPRLSSSPDWTIAWDEHAALRMLAATTSHRFASGLIWATDHLSGGVAARQKALLMLRMLRGIDLFFCLSSAQVVPLRDALGSRSTRVEFMAFGIDADFFSQRPLPSTPSVMSVGNDIDRDTHTLLDAFAIVHSERPDVRLQAQFRGDHVLPEGVERLPLMSHSQLRELYAETTVVAVATRPNLHLSGLTATLEGMATGRPVVQTRTPGIGDYVRDGDTGWLVEPRDPATLARRILDSLDPQTATQLGSRARAAVVERFTTSVMATGLAQLLND
jgi:glycosyltransferase involved in cell wall biosynthesis